ncbi:MAG: M50 family metallopeptidase [Actinomycetota bacterium]
MSAVGVIIFIGAILASIGLHEFGHFIAAKRFRIKVEQFFIGFGPRVWSVRRGETEYGIKALPLGGYVRIAGMNPFEEIAPEDRDRVFKARKPWQRAIVLGAGSFTHFVLAAAIITVILSMIGVPDFDRPTTTVESVTATVNGDRSPAAQAGIVRGDTIVSVAGARVRSWQHAVDLIKARPGEITEIVFLHEGQTRRAEVRIADHKPDGTKVGFLGVGPRFDVLKRSVFGAAGESFVQIGRGAWASLLAIKDLFSPHSLGRLFKVVTGTEQRLPTDPATVVGIGQQAGGLARTGDFAGLFYLIAGFNVFIGVANLLPLPPLDGGHLAVLAYEKIRGRDVDMRRLLPVTAAVISIFGSLFLLLLYLDIVKPLPGIPG